MSRFGPDLEPATVPGEWTWIAPVLGAFGTVGGLVPSGFERCLRIDHGDDQDHDGWGLPAEIVGWITVEGARHTTTPDRALFAIWEGYGWSNGTVLHSRPRRGRFSFRRRRDPFEAVVDEFEERKAQLAAELQGLSQLEVPNRAYFVLTGPVRAAATVQDPVAPSSRRPPDLWWPADRAWFVGSDTDIECTYLAGSEQFTSAVTAAWPGRVRPATPDQALG